MLVFDDLDDVLVSNSEPGLSELHVVLREVLGRLDLAANVIQAQQLKMRVYRLRVRVNDAVRSLVLKRTDLRLAQRNRLVAEHWLPAIGMGNVIPRLLGVAAVRDGEWVWHIYDDLGDRTLRACAGEQRAVEDAAELIAQLHARSAGHPLLARCRLFGDDLGMPFYTANVQDAIRILEHIRPSVVELSSERSALLVRLLARLYQRLEEQPARTRALAEFGGPEVLLHGDLWPANIVMCQAEDGPRARLIDWDHAGVGPISYDISTLLSRFPPRERSWVLDCYRRSVERLGWTLPSEIVLNQLFETAEWARWTSCLIGPALGVAEGKYIDWGFETLASVEQWTEQMTPILPHEETTAAIS
jgi:thiamine kinase-like enzyme